MCDVESYIYMPLLEEMDYIPKQKYSTGYELRLYAEKVAEKYQLLPKSIFRVKVQQQSWIEDQGEWSIDLVPTFGVDPIAY